jgi:RimJ/RimL family protein N-acetyltransferase
VPTLEPDGRSLVGRYVRLDRASLADAPELFAALDDERVWAAGYGGGPSGRPRDVAAMSRILRTAVDAATRRQRLAYIVRLMTDEPEFVEATVGAAGAGGTRAAGASPTGTVVGTTSLGDWDLINERAHIGWTAYGPAWWGGNVNAECKLLMLGHAFEDCQFGRVKLQTDALNERSQAAIARLGATREGVLRRHQKRADGTFRDTVVYSVLREEWPDVRAALLARLT